MMRPVRWYVSPQIPRTGLGSNPAARKFSSIWISSGFNGSMVGWVQFSARTYTLVLIAACERLIDSIEIGDCGGQLQIFSSCLKCDEATRCVQQERLAKLEALCGAMRGRWRIASP